MNDRTQPTARALWDRGWTLVLIGRALRWSLSRVKRTAKLEGWPERPRKAKLPGGRQGPHEFPPDVLAAARDAYERGAINDEVAAVLGCGESTVQRLARRHGWKRACPPARRAPPKLDGVDLDAVKEQWDAGQSRRKIAKWLEVDVKTLRAKLAELGWTRPTPPPPKRTRVQRPPRPSPPPESVRPVAPALPPGTVESVEDFLRRGGSVKRCPSSGTPEFREANKGRWT